MFTGIIKEIGLISTVIKKGQLLQYSLSAPKIASHTELGASISVNGVCQTVTKIEGSTLSFDPIDETLSKTTIGNLKSGSKVHLEPALTLQQGLDGHLVYGHIDGKGKVTNLNKTPGRFDLTVLLPEGSEKYVLDGGSIALDGVSLTVFRTENKKCSVSLIPETLDRTLFSALKIGDSINIEVDTIGKWIEKWTLGATSQLNLNEKLRKWGY